jgi:hypothetical protein
MGGGEVVLREGERRVGGSVREVEEKGGGLKVPDQKAHAPTRSSATKW